MSLPFVVVRTRGGEVRAFDRTRTSPNLGSLDEFEREGQPGYFRLGSLATATPSLISGTCGTRPAGSPTKTGPPMSDYHDHPATVFDNKNLCHPSGLLQYDVTDQKSWRSGG